MAALIVVAIAVAVALLTVGLVVVVTRRSHLRSWRLGVFFESEDRWQDPPSSSP